MRQYVFLDECGVTTDLLRRYGRSPIGTRLRDHTPCGHWETHTVVAAVRLDGFGAAAVFNGPIDNAMFLAYVNQILIPTLRPGDVVVLDNLRRPQTTRRARGDRSRRCPPPLLAALQSGFQSDRTGLCETESVHTRGAAPNI
jgi:hypothetical protein